jgi:hypothetical protein
MISERFRRTPDVRIDLCPTHTFSEPLKTFLLAANRKTAPPCARLRQWTRKHALQSFMLLGGLIIQ